MSLSIVILAAGQGKRMKSARPKVLHPIAGQPMLAHVIAAARKLAPGQIAVVIGHGGDQVKSAFPDSKLSWAIQEPQLGTGHAVMQALPLLPKTGTTLVLYGDVPLITAATLDRLMHAAEGGKLAWLTMHVANPFGLGRIIRDAAGNMIAIANERDATPEQKKIDEIWSGFVACPTDKLHQWLPQLGNKNAEGEYYLTDILEMARRDKVTVATCFADHEWEIAGINSKDQQAGLERTYQMETAKRLMAEGVTLMDPARVDVRGELTCERDVSIDVNCIFEGKVNLAAGATIGANCILRDCTIGAGTEILPFTSIDGATIGANARIGPYARIRPATTLADEVHIGNFVEVKASDIGQGSKANHLSYVGDTTVGKKVNIGAGTITCNYDGANKHRTVIEDEVHIGSDVQLIAPVTIGKGADIGAGTTVWKDVPPGGLTLNEKTQVSKPGWKRPVKPQK
jgi:bifunctional UDP-N-acetylglucosamine pyrophosphorylase/glucosamine-1-phosphate N-acetyltransferase